MSTFSISAIGEIPKHATFLNKVKFFINGLLYRISEREYTLIRTAEPLQLCEWYQRLNGWNSVCEFDPIERKYKYNGRRYKLMELIKNQAGEKGISRWHNIDMSDEHFELWWKGNNGDEDAYNKWREISIAEINREKEQRRKERHENEAKFNSWYYCGKQGKLI